MGRAMLGGLGVMSILLLSLHGCGSTSLTPVGGGGGEDAGAADAPDWARSLPDGAPLDGRIGAPSGSTSRRDAPAAEDAPARMTVEVRDCPPEPGGTSCMGATACRLPSDGGAVRFCVCSRGVWQCPTTAGRDAPADLGRDLAPDSRGDGAADLGRDVRPDAARDGQPAP